jgi:hypothetical protein
VGRVWWRGAYFLMEWRNAVTSTDYRFECVSNSREWGSGDILTDNELCHVGKIPHWN